MIGSLSLLQPDSRDSMQSAKVQVRGCTSPSGLGAPSAIDEDGLQLGAAVFLAFSGVWSDIQNKDFQKEFFREF